MFGLTLVITLAALAPNAQAKGPDPCLGVTHSKDAFGVESWGEFANADLYGYTGIQLGQNVDEDILALLFILPGAKDVAVPVGTPAKLALADGTIVELASSKEALPETNANRASVYTRWIVQFSPDAALLAKLSGTAITEARSEIMGTTVQFALIPRFAGKLKKAAACVAAK